MALYNLCNTILSLPAYDYETTGGNYGAKIILNGGNNGSSLISFINDATTRCTMTTNGSVGFQNTRPLSMLCYIWENVL